MTNTPNKLYCRHWRLWCICICEVVNCFISLWSILFTCSHVTCTLLSGNWGLLCCLTCLSQCTAQQDSSNQTHQVGVVFSEELFECTLKLDFTEANIAMTEWLFLTIIFDEKTIITGAWLLLNKKVVSLKDDKRYITLRITKPVTLGAEGTLCQFMFYSVVICIQCCSGGGGGTHIHIFINTDYTIQNCLLIWIKAIGTEFVLFICDIRPYK